MGIYQDIMTGTLDDDLEQISEAVRRRKEMISVGLFYELKIGDIVAFNSHVRPAYLQGVKGKVIDKKQKKVVVELINIANIGRFGKTLTAPVSILNKVEE